MGIYKIISKIRVIAFSLFFVTSISLIGSLLIHNYIVKFKYTLPIKYSKVVMDKPGSKFSAICNLSNGFCTDVQKEVYSRHKKIGECFKHVVEKKFYADGKLIYNDELIDRMGITSQSEYESIINDLYSNQIINLEFVVVDTVNKNCIKNSSYYSIYRIIPKLFDYLGNLKSQGLNLAVFPHPFP